MLTEKSPTTQEIEHPCAEFSDTPWVGDNFNVRRIMVLGESWYGDWGAGYNSDHSYVAAYLAGKLRDGMYTKMANACGISRNDYWHGIVFTNFVTWAGSLRTDRPTKSMYMAAAPRLERLLQEYKPKGVWILGKEQSEFSKPVLQHSGIPYEVSFHPTSFGLRNQVLGESWHRLQSRALP